jgi:hypothetical protein
VLNYSNPLLVSELLVSAYRICFANGDIGGMILHALNFDSIIELLMGSDDQRSSDLVQFSGFSK